MGAGDFFLEATEMDTLAEVAALAERGRLPHFLLGEGSNVCVSDAGVRGSLKNVRRADIGPRTYADAGHNFMRLFQKTLHAHLSGRELRRHSGTVAGALVERRGRSR